MIAALLLCAGGAAALVLPVNPSARVAGTVSRTSSPLRMQFDEEGGMVKGIEEGTLSFEQRVAQSGAAGPTLPADKAAKLVLKAAEWNVVKMVRLSLARVVRALQRRSLEHISLRHTHQCVPRVPKYASLASARL